MANGSFTESGWAVNARWVAQVMLIPWVVGMSIWVASIDREQAVMLGNRHTSKDQVIHMELHAAQATEMAQQIAQLWLEFANLRADMAALPPDEFERRVRELERRIYEMTIRIAALAKDK